MRRLLSTHDSRFLRHALDLARESAAFASPNPTVGCVLVRDEVVLATGAHRYDERDHAEIVALKRAGAAGFSVRGATAYVTLEPCAHHGRTGPCANALIEAGIARCVVATVDPNPLVSGNGLERMRQASVEVILADPASPLARAARRLNEAFAFSIQHGRPFVTLKSAVSLDGMLAPSPAMRSAPEPVWLTGQAARNDVQQLRHESDALLTGIGTVLADNPLLTDRTGEPRRRPLIRVVLDTNLRIPLDSKLVRSASNDLLLIASSETDSHKECALRERGVNLMRVNGLRSGATPALSLVLAELQARGIRSVLVEAGSQINASFLAARLVDKAILYFSEVELGVDAVPFTAGESSVYALAESLSSASREAFPHDASGATEDVKLSGYLHDPWAGFV